MRQEREDSFAKGLSQGEAIGLSKGEAIGLSKGEARGLEKTSCLIRLLLADGRLHDLQKASEDPEYLKKLCEELNIAWPANRWVKHNFCGISVNSLLYQLTGNAYAPNKPQYKKMDFCSSSVQVCEPMPRRPYFLKLKILLIVENLFILQKMDMVQWLY